MPFDSHAHLDYPDFDADLPDVIRRALEAGLLGIVTAGTSLASSRKCVEIADRYPCVHAAVGIHPHDADKAVDADFETLEELLNHPKVVAVGEIGLDRHYAYGAPENQERVFARMLAMAKRHEKPVIIHSRNADDDALASVLRHGIKRAVFHCFTGSPETGLAIASHGYYLGITGIVTFNNPSNAELAKSLPLANLLPETDCPFLSPKPFRGKRNEPCRIPLVVEKLALLFNRPVSDVETQLRKNAAGFFNLTL